MKECGQHTGEEKRKYDEESRGKRYYMKKIQQMEERRQHLYGLRESILTRQRDESESICSERHFHMYEKYFQPQTMCTV
jgi:hypothetical protein